jgi:hypothetical protein
LRGWCRLPPERWPGFPWSSCLKCNTDGHKQTQENQPEHKKSIKARSALMVICASSPLLSQGFTSKLLCNVEFWLERLPKRIVLCETTAIAIPNSGLQTEYINPIPTHFMSLFQPLRASGQRLGVERDFQLFFAGKIPGI